VLLIFICFDFVEFYSSISQDLLNRALDFASAYDVTDDEQNIIIHAKNLILIHKQQTWHYYGSYDSAETSEIVGSFLLSQLQNLDVNIQLLAITTAQVKDVISVSKRNF